MNDLLSPSLLERLRASDTPTVCNAIEVAQGRRGFAGFTRRTMYWAGGPSERIVGFARTAKIAGREPPSEPVEVIRQRRMAYFQSMAEGPRPGVAVVEDCDGDAALGAWWGEVHCRVHACVFGLCGAVTNGLMRDLGDMTDGFPLLSGGIGPSHGFVHVREFGGPVEIFGLTVHQGDLVHADRHGALVVPLDVLPKLDAALDKLQASEALVLDPLRDGPVPLDDFAAAWAAFEKART